MPEGGIYLCNCIHKESQFFLTLQTNKNIISQGSDLDECMQNICLQILDWNGDGEAVLELFPTQNKKGATGTHLFRSISYNHSVDIIKGFDAFNEGVCKRCMHGIGGRNDNPLEIRSKPEGLVSGVLRCYPNLKIYSKKLLEKLSDEEKTLFEVRPVLFNGEETGFFEALPQVVIPYVGHKGASYPDIFHQSWKCNECGRESFRTKIESYDNGTIFIDSKHLVEDIPSLLFVDTGMSIAMSFRNDRWDELLASKGVKGLLSDSVVVLDSEHTEMPDLTEPKEFDWII